MDQIKQLQKLAGVSEASVNISLNGTNSAEIQDLMGIFQKDARAPLPPTGIAKPPISITPMDGPDLPDVKAPMGLDGPLPPMPPPKPMGLDMDKPSSCSTCGGIHSEEEECGEGTEWDNSPKEEYQDTEFMTKDIAGGINGPKDPKDIRVKDPSSMEESTFKKQLWQALQEKYFTEFDGRDEGNNQVYPKEEQSFSGRNDRTYFVVPNDEDYMDIQNDRRFAGDIEVPDENADIMALPNSKARKLKMMFGGKVKFLGTDYDEAVAQMSQEEGYQTTPEEDSENNSMYDEEMDRIRELSGLQNEEDNKKPDEDGDGVPDWADKKPGEDDAEKKKARRRHLANISRTKARGRK